MLSKIRHVWVGPLVFLTLPRSPAHAHGFSLMLIPIMLGPLVVHLGVPGYLLFSASFRGRRARIFGSYALIMSIYYIAMWSYESFAMYLLPVAPLLLASIFYVAAARFREDD